MLSNAWSSFTPKPWLCLTAFQAQKLLTEVLRALAKVLLMSRKLLWLILILL